MFVFVYGVSAYVVFVLTLLYAVAFVGNWDVTFTLDGLPGGIASHPGAWLGSALALGTFGALHVALGRPEFRRAWRRYLPPALERSTRVLVSSIALMLVFLLWRPVPVVLWDLGYGPLGFTVEVLSWCGWGLAVASTFLRDHLELFGLKQAIAHARGEEPAPSTFQLDALTRRVRQPLTLGLLVALWCAPLMTLGHLLFAGLVTGFLLFLVRQEEAELARIHPQYRAYQAHVPMLNPFGRRARGPAAGPGRSRRAA